MIRKIIQRSVIAISISMIAMTSHASGYDVLKMGARATFPPDIRTVGQATRYLLEPTGYKLLLNDPAPYESEEIASQPISKNALSSKVYPVEDVILRLVGKDNRIIIDHENKLVSFEYHNIDELEEEHYATH